MQTRSTQAACLRLMLVVCLLFAQWLGTAHAISHASLNNNGVTIEQVESAAAGGWDHQPSARSCVLLDAATLGAALHTPAILAPVLAAVCLHQQTANGTDWAQTFLAYFSSRAPPLTA